MALRTWTTPTLEAAPSQPGAAVIGAGEPPPRIEHRCADAAANDWDLLFAAVAYRLGRSVAEPAGAGADLGTVVTECLQALTLLQSLRTREREDRRAFEGQLRRSDEALAAARIELDRSRLSERRTKHMAQHDGLTSLPNRDCFSARVDHDLLDSQRRAPSLAVLFLDLDGFKPINDRHGHDTGDELRRIIAGRLLSSVRQRDMVCRMGGDEFACVVSGPQGRQQVGRIAAKLVNAVSAPLQVGSLQLRVRPSIGIAMAPSDGDTATTLLRRADLAMYRAKRGQLGFAFFDRDADA